MKNTKTKENKANQSATGYPKKVLKFWKRTEQTDFELYQTEDDAKDEKIHNSN
jgi:hypothetical protein